MYTYIPISLPLVSPSHPPYPTPLGGHKAPSWSPCAMQLLPTSYFTFGSVYMSMPLSYFVLAYPSPSLCPQVHSLRLCLYSCPAPRFFRNFFFSSRRRHTRSLCDWSSDVCSSDLIYLIFFKHLYWSIIALQCCVSFCCITIFAYFCFSGFIDTLRCLYGKCICQ